MRCMRLQSVPGSQSPHAGARKCAHCMHASMLPPPRRSLVISSASAAPGAALRERGRGSLRPRRKVRPQHPGLAAAVALQLGHLRPQVPPSARRTRTYLKLTLTLTRRRQRHALSGDSLLVIV